MSQGCDLFAAWLDVCTGCACSPAQSHITIAMVGTRRSTRTGAKSSTIVESVHVHPAHSNTTNESKRNTPDPSEVSDSEHEVPAVRTRKRKDNRAARGPPRKRKKGKLSSVLTLMPNEVIGEICSYLQPSDLIHLVQSSKIFAIFLLAKASATIWRSARMGDEGLPECPSDITEQQYACLLFGHYCQGCGKTGCRITSKTLAWQIRRRWCDECRSCATEDERYLALPGPSIGNGASDLVPRNDLVGARRWAFYAAVCKKSHFDSISQQLKELEGDDTALAAFIQSQRELLSQGYDVCHLPITL
ncbi:hypothetical protein DL93DRAFT_1183667 [Clavulina sp. PMI_390]|nr:hypothetical protein DL93DRAFT_1183667 [Clavulina sp. PMI_390]